MSDERTSPTPNAAPCPVCATGYRATPGASCPACGRSFEPMPTPPVYDFRLRTESPRLDGPQWILFGMMLSCGGFLLAVQFPGVLIPLSIIGVLALVRTARLARGRENEGFGSLFALFLAALGVSLLTGLAAGAACFAVCLTTLLVGDVGFGMGLGILAPAFIAGGVTALVVFVWLFAVLWPRADPSEPDPGED